MRPPGAIRDPTDVAVTAPSASAPLLEARGLSVSFGSLHALVDVELALHTGEIIAVTGEPGSGKTTLLRALAGDLPGSGTIRRHTGAVGVVWEDLELCDNLDVAGNLLLGRERWMSLAPNRLHARAAALLSELGLPIGDTTRLAGELPGSRRQLLAIARALALRPRVLLLDEPTTALRAAEVLQVESLILDRRSQGTAIVLVSRDLPQIFRLADRILVLRHGTVIAELRPQETHPDELAALLSGQRIDTSARRQLTRLHGLAGQLMAAGSSSGLSLILSAIGAALRSDRLCIHVLADERRLQCAATLGLSASERASLEPLPEGDAGGTPRAALAERAVAIAADRRALAERWPAASTLTDVNAIWSVPVLGPVGIGGVITVFRAEPGEPSQDELDLLTVYAGYAASAIERDRLLEELKARNRTLETIREMLQTLTGPVTADGEGLAVSLVALRRGLQADEVALVTSGQAGPPVWRGYSGRWGSSAADASEGLRQLAAPALLIDARDGRARSMPDPSSRTVLAVPFDAPSGPAALLAAWPRDREAGEAREARESRALIEDAAHSLNLALERESAALAQQEAAALRRSRELQRGFLSRLSHELRTPLTAIRGYASSLMAPDVTWDGESQQRFLSTIASESARLGRLVDDLLDFSAIESGVLRLQPDWCEVRLIVQAAISCLPPAVAAAITLDCPDRLPPLWGDHDRLEQVFVNLLGNAVHHNPAGTRVRLTASIAGPDLLELVVADDGAGFPQELRPAPFDSARRERTRRSGAGLGLSISRGIIEAHGGSIRLLDGDRGTAWSIRLPIEAVRSGAVPHTVGIADG
jgi:signal transduction histidine kinase